MKAKILLFILFLAAMGTAVWVGTQIQMPQATVTAGGRKILYYQSSMHPWIKSDKPGKCPICGMDLVPVYASDDRAGSMGSGNDTNWPAGTVTLGSESIHVINVQTDVVKKQPVVRTLHFTGTIEKNSATAAWFVFEVYQRDMAWLRAGQKIHVTLLFNPERTYDARIKLHGVEPFADKQFNEMSDSTRMRAEISDAPVSIGNFGGQANFNGFHAEGHVVAETGSTLTIPRSAILSRGLGAMVYVDKGNGHYAPRAVRLGRIGDTMAEVLAGLDEGEKVVTTGNLLIDSEAQLAAGQ